MKKVVVFSGGLDSTILLYKVVKDYGRENVNALTFNYGQRNDYEIIVAEQTCRILNITHKIIDISFLGELSSSMSSLCKNSEIEIPTKEKVVKDDITPSSYIPYRNAILASIAFSYAEVIGSDSIYFGFLECGRYAPWDVTFNFAEAMNKMSSYNTFTDIEFKTPFMEKTKEQEIEIGIQLNVPFENTWTCYNVPVDGKACGICEPCLSRKDSFKKIGIIDPIQFKDMIS